MAPSSRARRLYITRGDAGVFIAPCHAPFAQKLRGGAIAIERVGGTTASGAMSIIQPLGTEPNPRIRQHTRGDIGGV